MSAFAANETVKEKIKTDLGVDAGDHDFLGFKGLEQSVRDDVKIVKDSPMIDHALPVYGYIYDVRITPKSCRCHLRSFPICSRELLATEATVPGMCRRASLQSALVPRAVHMLCMPWTQCQTSSVLKHDPDLACCPLTTAEITRDWADACIDEILAYLKPCPPYPPYPVHMPQVDTGKISPVASE